MLKMNSHIYSSTVTKLVLIYVLTSTTEAGNTCPAAEISFPCTCYTGQYSGISCTGVTSTLKPIFLRINAALKNEDKKFYSLYVGYTGITELEEEVFSDITFERINMDESSLTRIHVNAFKSNTNDLKEIYIWGASNVSNFGGDYNALKAFGSLVNLERLFFSLNGLQDIPDNAFATSNGVQSKFWQLSMLSNGNANVRSIGNYAFYYMTDMIVMELNNYNIEHISRHAFDFYQSSSRKVNIYLDNNKLNATSFETEAFLQTKRETWLWLSGNRIEYLDENIFLSFLLKDSRNRILMGSGNPIKCDCKMFWLYLRKSSLESQVDDFMCDNEITFWQIDSSHFDQCYGS